MSLEQVEMLLDGAVRIVQVNGATLEMLGFRWYDEGEAGFSAWVLPCPLNPDYTLMIGSEVMASKLVDEYDVLSSVPEMISESKKASTADVADWYVDTLNQVIEAGALDVEAVE